MLKVKKLDEGAIAPTVAIPGEDVAFDLYALHDVVFSKGDFHVVHTGIAIEFEPAAGAVIKCRSGLAKKGFSLEGGVIDAGYRGEMVVMLRYNGEGSYAVTRGDRVAQFLKQDIVTDEVHVVEHLSKSQRGDKGFGSSGN